MTTRPHPDSQVRETRRTQFIVGAPIIAVFVIAGVALGFADLSPELDPPRLIVVAIGLLAISFLSFRDSQPKLGWFTLVMGIMNILGLVVTLIRAS